MMQASLLVVGSFLLGSLPFSVWVARLASGTDLREVGSHNPGATNVLRVAGAGPAALALSFDIAKGALPVLAAFQLGHAGLTAALAGLAATLGHVVSPFLGLRGGKGVATAAGALAVLSPAAAGAGLVAFLVVVAWTRYVSLGSMTAALVIMVAEGMKLAAENGSPATTLASSLIACVVLVRHVPNIKRLLEGEELRLGRRAKQT